MAGEADGLVVDALHQAAVAGERPGTMIDQIVAEYGAEVPLRNGHADRHREALSQRSRRRLDTRQHEIFGMSGAGRIELPEVADVLHRRLLVAGEGSEEHTSELQSLMRISYAVFCLKKKTKHMVVNMISIYSIKMY